MKVLLVDDDAKLVAAIRRGLNAEGIHVEPAFDGVDGLWRAREGSYDVIVLDVMLPGRNGYQVCEELRRAGITTPVLMLTAMDDPLDETEGLDVGADDYVRKPFEFGVLVARLHALVRRSGLGEAAPLSVGDLTVDPRGRAVTVAGRAVRLTAREFDVLTYLVRRAGSVVSKRELVDAVWEDEFTGDLNIVEVYVARLRRKVDEPFGTATLETVRGVGYRLRAS